MTEIDKYTYAFSPAKWTLTYPEKIDELAEFYSKHYGLWSEKSPHSPTKRIVLSANRLKAWLDNELSELWTVKDNGELIGYAIALKGKSGSNEKIIWVTQFVIHSDYRNIGIGKRLLFSIWGFSSFFAWGLVTANPYAVRALEKATRRRCEPTRIKKNVLQLLNLGRKNVTYIGNETECSVDNTTSKINTEFYVDHSEINDMLSTIISKEKPWILGEIEEGWEWFAFTFNDQIQFELSAVEIETMLRTSDSIAQEAYNRMLMDNPSHKWAEYTISEIDYIIKECYLSVEKKILDIGCGMGRHTHELCRRGYVSTGIDYAETLIENAKEKAKEDNLNSTFLLADITESDLSLSLGHYDCVLCLYDVIGSYADNSKNIQILKNISSLLTTDGYAVISVMNLHLTKKIAKNKFVLSNSSKELLELASSDTMETTGNIFNPEFYLIDEETNVIYRKETFSSTHGYPKELIVRDRRYFMDEIVNMCKNAGLEVVTKRFVCAGWKQDYESVHEKAKEILLVCKKRQ